jgi:formylglycine-generating enzyme required for sulfatase activity
MPFLLFIGIAASTSVAEKTSAKETTLQDAIKARTEVVLLAAEAAELSVEVRTAMRRVLAKAEGQHLAASILLTTDDFDEAVKAFSEAEALYRHALDGRQVLEQVAQARKKAERARAMAETSLEEEQSIPAQRTLINAEGYAEAGEFEEAIAHYEAAGNAYRALLTAGATSTLEEAVAARTAMIMAKRLVKTSQPEVASTGDDSLRLRQRLLSGRIPGEKGSEQAKRGSLADLVLRGNRHENIDSQAMQMWEGSQPPVPRPPSERIPVDQPPEQAKRGSLADLLARAKSAESTAGEALAERDFAPARALFSHAEKLYLEAVTLQRKIDQAIAVRTTAEEAMQLADKAFETEARPASFERGKQALEDGAKALNEEDLEGANQLFSQAVEQFGNAMAEAKVANALTKAQQNYSELLAKLDKEVLARLASEAFTSAQRRASDAEGELVAGQLEKATGIYQEAVSGLIAASSQALTEQNSVKAEPIIERLEDALGRMDKFAAEDILAELEHMIPSSERMPNLRERVSALPGLKKELALELGGGVRLEMVLIRPGKFKMGSEVGPTDEKPAHEAWIDKPFYIGKYEVTQAQWRAVMGGNPSYFRGPDLPVEQVSWYDCQEFLTMLNGKVKEAGFRLPTEAEWEYACRAGSRTDCGDDGRCLGRFGWYSSNSGDKAHPVGKKKPNSWGLYDMHGNVLEWCEDTYQDNFYSTPEATEANVVCTNTGVHVLRGGRWGEDAAGCRSARRYLNGPDHRSHDVGLRVVCLK